MKYAHGFWFPDSETHFIEYLSTFPEYQNRPKQVLDIIVTDWNLVIDIGGHVGTWATWFAKRAKQVYSFEPMLENYECLVKNTESFTNVKLINKAVSKNNEPIILYAPPVASNTGTYTVIPTEGWSPVKIAVVKIDNYNLDPTVVKMDIQGAEYNALLGAKETIIRSNPIICCEENYDDTVNINQIKEFMDQCGYWKICKIKEDAIWAHKSKKLTSDEISKLLAIGVRPNQTP